MERNILCWLENSSRKFPEKTAFADPDNSVSFSELEKFAKQGGSFISCKAPQRTPVLFCIEKSVDAVIAMFSAVYAGCFYSFLEANQPSERIAKVIETLQPSLIIADKEGTESLKDLKGIPGVFTIDQLLSSDMNEAELNRRRVCSTDLDPLYVNFTSGSTGVPKGVTIGHRSVIDFIPDFTKIMGITSDDVLANQAPFDFDVSVKDIYSGIYTGATVNLIPREYFSIPVKLMDYLADRNVTAIIWAVSAMCFVSIMNGFEYRLPEKIRVVGFSGEVMPPKHLRKWRKYLPKARFVNLYGPTEITCNCTYFIVDRDYEKDEVIPAGKPFPNEIVFLLDENNNQVTAEGFSGEICVAGSCLGLGYYNNREKTDEAFVRNPLNLLWNQIIYKTGDIGKYDSDGNLIYVSRKDFQIKHLGHRIELGEIESVAMESDAVTRACCIYDEKRARILLFYTGSIEKESLSILLKEKLPHFMQPNFTMSVETMPMTKNGKIDRKALTTLYEESKRQKI